MKSRQFHLFVIVFMCATCIAPHGRGDTGSPPPPIVSSVENTIITKQNVAHFRRVVMPGYIAWLASTGAADNVGNFTFYLICCRYMPVERSAFLALYLETR